MPPDVPELCLVAVRGGGVVGQRAALEYLYQYVAWLTTYLDARPIRLRDRIARDVYPVPRLRFEVVQEDVWKVVTRLRHERGYLRECPEVAVLPYRAIASQGRVNGLPRAVLCFARISPRA